MSSTVIDSMTPTFGLREVDYHLLALCIHVHKYVIVIRSTRKTEITRIFDS